MHAERPNLRDTAHDLKLHYMKSFDAAAAFPAEQMLGFLGSLSAIAVFEGNTVSNHPDPQGPEHFAPTSYRDSDELLLASDAGDHQRVHAMLGGKTRAVCAAAIAAGLGERAPEILFVGGNPDRKESTHGVRHSGSDVYRNAFEQWVQTFSTHARLMQTSPLPFPSEKAHVIDRSENSLGDIRHVIEAAMERLSPDDNSRISVGILSSAYHLPRLQAAVESLRASRSEPRLDRIDFVPLSAEGVLLSLANDRYKDLLKKVFVRAYDQDTAVARLEAERTGTMMIRAGTYRSLPGKPTV